MIQHGLFVYAAHRTAEALAPFDRRACAVAHEAACLSESYLLVKTDSVHPCPLETQISEFLFGKGFAVAEGELWKVRRRAVAPSLHKAYLETMVGSVFGPCALQLNRKLEAQAESGESFDIESNFSQASFAAWWIRDGFGGSSHRACCVVRVKD